MLEESLRRILAVGSATAVTVFLLAGCVQGDSDPVLSPDSSTATAAPAPEVGTSITADDAEALNDAAGQYRAYEMPDGTFLVIDSEVPLPDPVKAAVSAEAESNVNVFDEYGVVLPKPNSAIQLANAVTKETGRKVYVIAHLIPDFAGIDWVGYAYITQPWDKSYYNTQAEAEAAAIADAASQGIPASMVDTILANY